MPILTRKNVLFLASEAEPLIKVGGLGDVAGSLPRALLSLNQALTASRPELDVRLVLPFHPSINKDRYSPVLVAAFSIPTLDGEIQAKAYSLDLNGLPVYLIGGDPIDDETGVYSEDLEADGYKYVFFSMAALALVKKLDWKPDILHANDWHTAAAVYSLALNRPTDPFFGHTASVLTIHNLPYLGSLTSPALSAFDLPPAVQSDLPPWAQHMALPLGLLTADSIVAVSTGYSKEILSEEFGSGLETFLASHAEKITGILNGLDTKKWDPSTDGELASRFTVRNLAVRATNKSFLQDELDLEIDPLVPLLAMITRMDPQKGVDLAIDALRELLQSNGRKMPRFQAIFLGTGSPILEDAARKLEQDYPNRIRARILYSDRLSRHIYAGADGLLMPSRYEPCGLSQMIAMHYGCVPIARATGGLSDTIKDSPNSDDCTGFLFNKATSADLAEAIQRALIMYLDHPQRWQEIQIHGMLQDFSWDQSAQKYLECYRMLFR
jgi:starch synthase